MYLIQQQQQHTNPYLQTMLQGYIFLLLKFLRSVSMLSKTTVAFWWQQLLGDGFAHPTLRIFSPPK